MKDNGGMTAEGKPRHGSVSQYVPMSYGTHDQALWDKVAARAYRAHPESQEPLWVMYFEQLHDRAQYADGDRGLTGAQAREHFVDSDVLEETGARVALSGDIEWASPQAPPWQRADLVRYPNAASFIRTVTHPHILKRHHHKEAAVRATTVMAGTLRNDILLSPAGAENPPDADQVLSVVLWKYGNPEAIEGHLQRTPGVADKYDAKRYSWFEVEGELVHNHDHWDEVFVGGFPSAERYHALGADPEWARSIQLLEADTDRYVELMVRPTVNHMVRAT